MGKTQQVAFFNSLSSRPLKRRRIRKVVQELIYLGTGLVTSGQRLRIVFNRHCFVLKSLGALYKRFA
ncbi:hypothetical protein TRIP_B220111 [uncultured Desulfatiglans sp.]|nr:hypothetical protein TRIP_B220111 [uncultured Desulfatiglans sp.]